MTAGSTIRGGAGGAVIGIIWIGFFVLLALVSLGLGATTTDFQLVVRAGCLVVGAGLVLYSWMLFRALFPREGRLRVDVGDDMIEFSGPGNRSEVFDRSDIELIEIHEARHDGVVSLMVYGPGEVLLGSWHTNWIFKAPARVMRVLKAHGYPYALASALYGGHRFYRRAARPPL